MNPATAAAIAAVPGRKTFQMVKEYAHFSDAHTREVVERMNQRLFDDKVRSNNPESVVVDDEVLYGNAAELQHKGFRNRKRG